MDFVKELGDTRDVIEISVDGIGRAEVFKGRVRVTLTRAIERHGRTRECPCVTLVWSSRALLMNQHVTAAIYDLVLAAESNTPMIERVRIGRH